MSENQRIYSDVVMAWFDAQWQSGVMATAICDGMAERGHVIEPKQVSWLANRRGLNRPIGFVGSNGVRVKPRVEHLFQMSLDRAFGPREHADNTVAKSTRRYPVPEGGYRMAATR